MKKEMVGMVRKLLVGIVIKHACIRTEMGLKGLNGGQRGLEGVQVQQVGKWGDILRLLPSQNA